MSAGVPAALFPFSLALAAALLVKGYGAIGDGFTAGAVAGLGAVLQYVCFTHARARARVGGRWAVRLIPAGLLVILALMLVPVLAGAAPVSHVPRPGAPVLHVGAIELHTALAVDLGIALAVYGGLVATFDRLFPPVGGDGP